MHKRNPIRRRSVVIVTAGTRRARPLPSLKSQCIRREPNNLTTDKVGSYYWRTRPAFARRRSARCFLSKATNSNASRCITRHGSLWNSAKKHRAWCELCSHHQRNASGPSRCSYPVSKRSWQGAENNEQAMSQKLDAGDTLTLERPHGQRVNFESRITKVSLCGARDQRKVPNLGRSSWIGKR
jgi:hypothetical protein